MSEFKEHMLAEQQETNRLLRELIEIAKKHPVNISNLPSKFYPNNNLAPKFGTPYSLYETQAADPCPGCRPDTVCRTPACGRLKAKNEKRS